MKKTLISLAVLAASSAAQAQSSVSIYGAVDLNYTKASGTSVTMDERYNNRLGVIGSEDLGGGLKATFQLEQRFALTTGQSDSRGNFDGAANVGLVGNFGQVRLGRVNELSTETYRKIDPFEQYGVGGMFETVLRGNGGEGRLSNTLRYDSPVFSGFQIGASYSVKGGNYDAYDLYSVPMNAVFWTGNSGGPDNFWYGRYGQNNGYALSATYNNGPLYLVANYNKAVNSSSSYNWNVGGAYVFGPLKLSLGYEQTKLKDYSAPSSIMRDTDTIKNWIVGASYRMGNGTVRASYNQSEFSDNGPVISTLHNWTDKKFAIGYLHDLSKRTSVYVDYSSTKLDLHRGVRTIFFSYADQAAHTDNAVSVGITHKF